MNYLEKKQEIDKIKKIVGNANNKRISIKFTTIEINSSFLKISHTAGAYDGSFESINERLKSIGLLTIPELKQIFEITVEKGEPNSYYVIEFRIKAFDPHRIIMLKSKKMGNIPNALIY